MNGDAVAAACGRWQAILPAFGVATSFLRNKHGPCPLCGGKDRFRFDDKEGHGTYICNQCGAGNGMTMLRKLNNWDYRTACAEVLSFLGRAPAPSTSTAGARHDGQSEEQRAKRLAGLNKCLDEAHRQDIVEDYLRSRGLSAFPIVLRGHHSLGYYDKDGMFRGYRQAMIASVVGPDGSLQSVHRTYLGNVKTRKKMMPPVDTTSGCAIRLFDPMSWPSDTLGIAEGIETAIAVHELFNIPTWAVINDGNMRKWRPPENIKYLHIYGDNDRGFAGQTAAFDLAQKVMKTVEVSVEIPPEPGTDWLDVLNQKLQRSET